MSPFLARRQYNTPILYVGVERIACTNIEAAPKRPWKNDLSLGGNFGLHGKTILPPSRPISQHIIFSGPLGHYHHFGGSISRRSFQSDYQCPWWWSGEIEG